MSGWGMAWMGLSSLLFLALLIVGVIVLVRYLNRSTNTTTTSRSAEQILAERYARGEIDDQEYRQRLEVLRGSHRGG